MKKLFTAIMVIAVLLSTAVTGVYAKSLDPYGEIFTLEYDKTAVSLPDGKTDFVHQNGYIGDLGSGGAVVYRNVNFGDFTPKTAILYAGLPENHTGRVDLRLDSYSGTTIATFNLKGSEWSARTEQISDVLASVSGVHDVWLVQVGGNCRAYSFKFIPEEYELKPVGQYDGTGKYPADTSAEDRFYCELIGGLGFGRKNDMIDPAFPVTRGEFTAFVDWVMNYYNDGEKYFIDVSETHDYYGAITRLSSYGIVQGFGDLTFRPDNFITGDEAATICANALGYKKYPYSQYMLKKAQLISAAQIKDASEPIDTITAMKMFYEFLTSDYVHIDYGNETIYEKKNILESTRDIYLKKGIVDGNVLGYIDNPGENTDKDYVTIDKTMYFVNGCDAQRYLGRKCEYFVFEDDNFNCPEVLSITQDRKSAEYIINHDNDPYIENNTLFCETGSIGRIQLSPDTIIIYNQKTYENADISQILDMQNLKFENGLWVSNGKAKKEFQGEIRAVSYEGSNEADVIYVNYYENTVHAGYDSYNHVLKNKLSDKTYYIDVTDEENYGIVFIDGEVAAVNRIEENMGGVVYESINVSGIKAVNAYYTSDTVKGSPVSYNDEDGAEINSVVYQIAPEFLRLNKLEIGCEGEYILNPYGEIVWVITAVSISDNPEDRIVCFVKGYENDDDEKAYIRVYDLTEESVMEYVLAEKVVFDGEYTKDTYQAMCGTPLYENKMGINALKKGQVLKIRLNANNQVRFIDSPVTCGGGPDDCLKMLTASVEGEALVYRPDPKIFGSRSYGNKFAVHADAPVLYSSSPSSESYESDGFRLDTLDSLGRTDKEQQVVLFAFGNESNIASFVVKFTDVADDTNNQIYIFNGVSGDIIGHDEEITKSIEICEQGMTVNYTVSSKYEKTRDFSKILPGSLVKLGFDAHGEVISVNVVYSPDGAGGLISKENPESETTVNSGARMVLAQVCKTDNNFLQISFEKNSMIRTEYIPLINIPVMVCENKKSGMTIEKAEISVLTEGSEAVFILDYGTATQIIVYK